MDMEAINSWHAPAPVKIEEIDSEAAFEDSCHNAENKDDTMTIRCENFGREGMSVKLIVKDRLVELFFKCLLCWLRS